MEYTSECNYDWFDVFDGTSIYDPMLATNCGPDLPSDIISSGEFMFIEFFSDNDMVTGAGVQFSWQSCKSSSVSDVGFNIFH